MDIGTILRTRWRAVLRALHRDVGYLLVGLTFIYALSGLAINHIGSIDPNFRVVTNEYILRAKLVADDAETSARAVASQLGIEGEPRDAAYDDDGRLEITYDRRTVVADPAAGKVIDREEKPRLFFRVANWLHYNRGKAAWTYIADGYAVLLLFLATSGVFMIKGKKGVIGRGAFLIAAGALVPIVYVALSGGPGG